MKLMIEYRKLERDGHCSICGHEFKANQDEVRRIHCYFRSKNPIINICDECAYKIFYAPSLVDENSEVIS